MKIIKPLHLTILLASSLSGPVMAETYAGIELPGVPVEITDPVIKKSKAPVLAPTDLVSGAEDKLVQNTQDEQTDQQSNTINNTSKNAPLRQNKRMEPQITIDVKPGINQLIPISVGHLNRIITPFETPIVKTVSTATTEIVGNVVYVATQEKSPVTMFITDDSDSMALSLTLMPKSIPPREISLNVLRNASMSLASGTFTKAKKWEESSDYTETIKRIFENIAKGKTPPGYTLRLPQAADVTTLTRCQQRELATTPGQVLDGSNIFINIYVIENTSDHVVELNETLCYQPTVIAVSSWPKTILEPGQKTELMIAHSRKLMEKTRITRPSLLSENN